MTTTVSDRFRIRRGTAADLATVNEVPLADEIVYESDQGTADGRYKIKIGDGARHYNDLPYLAPSFPLDYISGLRLSYVDATHVQVGTGSAVIQSSGSLLEVATAISVAVTGTSQFLHLYLYDNAGIAAVEASTTAPATAYFGTARSKTSDATRRYVGSVRTDASGNLLSFYHEAQTGTVHYQVDLNNAALHLVTNGTATSDATISAATAVPVTARTMLAFAENNDTGSGLVFISNADAGSPASTHILAFIRASRTLDGEIQLTSSQTFTYEVQTTGIFSCYCSGYRFER